MTRYVLGGLGILLGLVVVVLVVGWSLPVKHTAIRSVTLDASPSDVYAVISNVGDYPAWRSDVERVEIVSERDRQPLRFREQGSNGAILYEVTHREPDRRLVTRIADPDLPFGGQWTYEIAPEGARGKSVLTITEDGEVYNPVFRFVSRFIMGHTGTMDAYLRNVRERVRPRGR